MKFFIFLRKRQSGVTLLELLAVLMILGVVMAIAAPIFLKFLETQRLVVANNAIYSGLRSAQVRAQQEHIPWQFSIRENGQQVEWAIHRRSSEPIDWQTVSSSLQLDDETTFRTSGGVRYTWFDDRGHAKLLGRVTLSSRRVEDVKRCVIVSTLIGAMRQSTEQARPSSGKYCY